MSNQPSYTVVRHDAFSILVRKEARKHSSIDEDVRWLEGRLKVNPVVLGARLTKLKVALPVYKTRLKDGCCRIGAQGGWRVIYAVNVESHVVTLLLIYHKRELENPSDAFLQQTLGAAMKEALARPKGKEK